MNQKRAFIKDRLSKKALKNQIHLDDYYEQTKRIIERKEIELNFQNNKTEILAIFLKNKNKLKEIDAELMNE